MSSKAFLANCTSTAHVYRRLTAASTSSTVPGAICDSQCHYHTTAEQTVLQADFKVNGCFGYWLQASSISHHGSNSYSIPWHISKKNLSYWSNHSTFKNNERSLVSDVNFGKRHLSNSLTNIQHGLFTSDLQRFLSEIGTNPNEARFWLKQFLRNDESKPFAVIEIDSEIFANKQQLQNFASAVSFVHRHTLPVVLILSHQNCHSMSVQELKAARIQRFCDLGTSLRSQGLETCILFAGSNVIEVESSNSSCDATVKKVNPDLIEWCLERGITPIVPSVGETADGQIIHLKTWEVTSAVAAKLQPLKVIKVNSHGGFRDEKGRIVPNVNIPFDFQAAKDQPWCSDDVAQTIEEVSSLLMHLPHQSSVVITSASKMLQELFTHHGYGTFLKVTEPVHVYNSLENVDLERLRTLFTESFGKTLSETYFEDIKDRVHKVFISEKYTTAAIVVHVAECDVPYLCKIAVSAQAQGEGTGKMLWETIQKHCSSLFWRSRAENSVNSWYLKNSEGNWSDKTWIVFWYGIPEPSQCTALIQKAISLPNFFHAKESAATVTS